VTKTLVITLTKKLGKIVYLVPNGADLRIFKPADKKTVRARFGIDQDALVVGYVGFISSRGYYNILPILLAIQRVRKRLNADIKLAVAGPIYDGNARRIIDYFKEELQYIGVLSTQDVVTFLSACDIGVIPRIDDPIYDYAVPTKFYEYGAIGLPLIVIANRESELSKIVEKNKLGFVCEPQDHVCLERALITLAMNKSLLDEFRKNVLGFRKYVDRKIGAERLFRLIKRLTFNNKNGI
jgi:glycosyltransferase involved in cell wall biosynthesis